MKPIVTVLMTVYNGSDYLNEAIESALCQTLNNFEFLIIDDASTDNSIEIINSYSDSRIKLLINDKNIGQTASLNKGLAIAQGTYIARLDQDDVSLANRVEEQISYLEKNPDLDIVCSWEHTIDHNGKRIRDWKTEIRNYGEFLGPVLLGLCPIWHPSIAFKTKAMINAGGFNADYTRAEDFEVTTRLALKRYNAAVVPRFHLLQRQHNNRQSILYGDKQLAAGRKVHNETISRFCSHQDVNCLVALLRLENDPCGLRYDRKHTKGILSALDEMIFNVKDKQNLTCDELESMENTIYRRLGLGVRFGGAITRLPSVLFYLAFFGLSPMLIPSVRLALSGTYSKLHELRYTTNLFKS